MMFVGGPVRVELMADLPVLLLLVCLNHEGVCEQLRPRQALAGRLVEKALEERFELG